MSERSPAFSRLCEAALLHFARNGYEGASLSTIADALGIRKASLYSHVKSKDELYLLLFSDAVAAEEDFALSCFAEREERALPGEAYLNKLEHRYQTSLYMQLLLKAAYFPPAQHRAQIVENFTRFYDKLRASFLEDFQRSEFSVSNAEKRDLYAESWLGIVDSLCVELLYGSPERTNLRKAAMTMLLSDALHKEQMRSQGAC